MIYKPVNSAIRLYLNHRWKRIEAIRNNGVELQYQLKKQLWKKLSQTEYVRGYGATRLEDMPITEYDAIKDDIVRMMDGSQGVLHPDVIEWYAKSSGTTSDRSKYIPISDDLFYNNIIAASWDTMAIIYNIWPQANIFSCKSLIMGGSFTPYPTNPDINVADISAIMIKRMPSIGRPFYAPDFDTALLKNWDEKIDKILKTCLDEPIVMFGGVPTWNIVLFDEILRITGKSNILEVWPQLNVYLHGGVSFEPYREKFKKYLPSPNFLYVEVYNASEGYFAIQDTADQGMLLLLNNDIYFEFVPVEHLSTPYDHIISIADVALGITYAMMITTSGGLVRYLPGDTVEFVSLHPYRIRVAGRTAQYINVFGEEVMVHNTDKALATVCFEMNLEIEDYTVAPIYFGDKTKASHEWAISFNKAPATPDLFAKRLDEVLREVNSDYDAKRYKDMALQPLVVRILPQGTFNRWLASLGKMGGQNKVPRLSNDRKYIDQILHHID